MKTRKSLMTGILSGLAPLSVYERNRYPKLEGSDISRMRGDVERVGKQLSTVMDRENGSKKTQRARAETVSK